MNQIPEVKRVATGGVLLVAVKAGYVAAVPNYRQV
jgi:hypothetical protein